MPDETLSDIKETLGVKKSAGDNGSMEEYSVDELIAADRYNKEVAATAPGKRGFRLMKIVPGGAP